MIAESFFVRRCLGVSIAVFILTACGGSQMQPAPLTALSQGLVSTDILPMDAVCPTVGKTYTRGGANGKVSIEFQEAYSQAGPLHTKLRTRLAYSNWPQDRGIIYMQPTMGSTCGPESGKPPVGQVRLSGGKSNVSCVQRVCTITLDLELDYTPPTTLPGGKTWKFDLIRFVPSKPIKDFEQLPSYRVSVIK
jgi:hypothetical protein